MRPEHRLLVAAVSSGTSGEKTGDLRRLAREVRDWPYFIERAAFHGVLPLACGALEAGAPDAVPPDALKRLQGRRRSNVAWNLSRVAELLRILSRFREAGVDAIPYKGPVFSAYAYGDACLRQYSDLDFLVPKAQAAAARDLLVADGYVPEVVVHSSREALYLKTQCEYTMSHAELLLTSELHWDVTQGYMSHGLGGEALRGDLMEVEVQGRTVTTLSPANSLFVILIHNGGKHHWEQLLWIVDVARLMAKGDIDWERTARRAAALGLTRGLVVAALLARDLAGAQIPAEVAYAAAGDRVAAALAARVKERIFADDAGEEGKYGHLRFSLALRPGLGRKVRYLAGHLRTPSHWEVADTALPGPLTPLYGLVKLGRWLKGK